LCAYWDPTVSLIVHFFSKCLGLEGGRCLEPECRWIPGVALLYTCAQFGTVRLLGVLCDPMFPPLPSPQAASAGDPFPETDAGMAAAAHAVVWCMSCDSSYVPW